MVGGLRGREGGGKWGRVGEHGGWVGLGEGGSGWGRVGEGMGAGTQDVSSV